MYNSDGHLLIRSPFEFGFGSLDSESASKNTPNLSTFIPSGPFNKNFLFGQAIYNGSDSEEARIPVFGFCSWQRVIVSC